MAMQLEVSHTTGYTYAEPVSSSYNEARMTPINSPGQLVLGTRLEVSPSPWTMRYRDYWGSMVTAFEVHVPHDRLLVESTATVQVSRRAPLTHGLTWDDYADPRLVDRMCEYLEVPDRVAPAEDFAEQVEGMLGGVSAPATFVEEVCRLVHDEVSYVSGSTEVHGTAADAWRERAGVCQDLAHLCLGALRVAGIPARYLSGYLHPSSDPVVGETVTGESHAWIEWWDGAWVGFDPTNAVPPDDRYVIVGGGRDYEDVAPLTGIFAGGETSQMFVEVALTRIE
jgi:transglutaminase-like putative cysteine protease